MECLGWREQYSHLFLTQVGTKSVEASNICKKDNISQIAASPSVWNQRWLSAVIWSSYRIRRHLICAKKWNISAVLYIHSCDWNSFHLPILDFPVSIIIIPQVQASYICLLAIRMCCIASYFAIGAELEAYISVRLLLAQLSETFRDS